MSTSQLPHAPAFPDLPVHYRLISFTGAGGKTTLSQWFSQSVRTRKQRTIVTTTTKVFPPAGERIILEEDGPDFAGRIREALNETASVVVARWFDHPTGKLIGLRPEIVSALHASGVADVILVEADGAARKPLKAPNATEPVIPMETDLCIGVMGLDAVYQPLDETFVHRPEIFARLAHCCQGEAILPEDMIAVAASPDGLFKGCPAGADCAVFLNKMDCPGHARLVDLFADLLARETPAAVSRWFAGSARKREAWEITPIRLPLHENAARRLEFLHEF